MKKLVVLSVFAIIVTGGIFAQEKTANARSNWASLGIGILTFTAQYERMLNWQSPFGTHNGQLSLGASFYGPIGGIAYDAFARFYPWGKTFFAGFGLGYHTNAGLNTLAGDYSMGLKGVGIVPELGWKIDVGEVGKFFIQPEIKLPFTIGVAEGDGSFGIGFDFVPLFGMGYAF